jgi:hypothetical protein
VTGVEETGSMTTFEAVARNISLSGLLLEAAVAANLWAEKPVTIELPDGAGSVDAIVRRFLEYGEGDGQTTRWGVEFRDLTTVERARWARFVFTQARIERDTQQRDRI